MWRSTISGGTTTYDFESNPTDKGDCKKGGYADFSFKNQGQCIAWLNNPKG